MKIKSNNRTILTNLVSLFAIVFIVKFVGLIKEIYFAKSYGISYEIDFYFFYMAIFVFPSSLILSLYSSIFIPEISGQLTKEKLVFSEELIGNTFVLTTVLFFIFVFFHEYFLTLLPNTTELDFYSIYFMLSFLIPLSILISLYANIIMAFGSKINTISEFIPAFVILIYLLFANVHTLHGLTFYTILGFLLQFFMLYVWIKINTPLKYQLGFKSNIWSKSFKNFSILLISSLMLASTVLIDQLLTSTLNEGSISILNYALKPINIMFAFGALVLQRVFLPDFSRMNSNNSLSADDALRWGFLVFLMSAFVSLFIYKYSYELLSFLFLRGAFLEADLLNVLPVFLNALLQIPFYFSTLVIIQYFLATRKVSIVAAAGLLAFAVKAPLNFILLDMLGVKGITLATSMMYIFSFILIYSYFFFKNYLYND